MTDDADDAPTDRREDPEISARLYEAGYLVGEGRAALLSVVAVPGRDPVVIMHGRGDQLARCVRALRRYLKGRRAGHETISEVSEVHDDGT